MLSREHGGCATVKENPLDNISA